VRRRDRSLDWYVVQGAVAAPVMGVLALTLAGWWFLIAALVTLLWSAWVAHIIVDR